MNKENKHQLFRLSAVLYADNNYEVVPRTIHRKVIESALLECGEKEYSVHQIIDFIQERYGITFDEESVKEIVTNKKEVGFLTNVRKGDLYVCLSKKRRQIIQAKIQNKTIDYFISEFEIEYPQLVSQVDLKEILYKFLYDLFSTNTSSFQKLINNKKDLSGVINLENSDYKDEEKEIINRFLQWDNFEKDRAIFNIASYALEYCMLTNKNNTLSIHLDNLRNKNFYLDTNIIYRALGINGENRQKRTQTFLKKFNESGEKLIISKSTETEFKEGIRAHIKRIRKYDTPRVNSKLYQEIIVQPDIYDFYHKWRIGKVNPNLDLFLAELFTIYDNFKREFKIEVDCIKPFNTEDEKTNKHLKHYASSIYSFKQSEGNEIVGSATIDAENILWLEMKREDKALNIFDTKYFFISTDQGLRRWDYQREDKTPIVLLPSQWMSILLRYLSRTEDDFKSFVSFLNLKNSEVLITSEQIHVVLAGIAEITTNLGQQRSLLNNLIENKFNGIISKDFSNETIFKNAKTYAKSKLESEVEKLMEQNEILTDVHEKISADMANHEAATSNKIQQLEDENEKMREKLLEAAKEKNHLEELLITKEIENKFKSWQKPAKLLIVLGIIIILFTVLQFCCQSWKYNFPYHLVALIDGLESETQKYILRILMYTPLIGLGKIAVIIYNRLLSKEKKEEKKKEIKKNITKNCN